MKLSEKGIIIRKTIENDLRQIYLSGKNDPEFSASLPGWSANYLAEIFTDENSVYFSAVRKKKVLGFISGGVKGRDSFIQSVIVNEKFRKSGIGTELITKFIEFSKKKGAENFFIAVFKNNPHSVKFFTDNGFSVKDTFIEMRRNNTKE